MGAQHRVWLRNPEGIRTAWLDGWTYLSYTLKLNDTGRYELHLPADHWAVEGEFFFLDGQVHILRQPEGQTLWNEETTGLIRYFRDFYEGGERRYVSIGRSPESLLFRRIIPPPEGEEYDTRGTDEADVVILGFVNDHIGPGAGTRQLGNFYVAAPTGVGARIRDRARYYKLLATVQRLASAGRIDFSVIPTYTAALDSWASIQSAGQTQLARERLGWLFQTHFPQLGADRRRGNADGNAPVIFALTRGNMENPSYTFDAIAIGNHCYVLGQGVGVNRTLVEVLHPSISDSPINDFEYSRDARHASLADTLRTIGEAENEKQGPREEFTFTASEVEGSLYGVHWSLGDWATAEYVNRVFDVRCTEVTVTITADGGEVVTAAWRGDTVDIT